MGTLWEFLRKSKKKKIWKVKGEKKLKHLQRKRALCLAVVAAESEDWTEAFGFFFLCFLSKADL